MEKKSFFKHYMIRTPEIRMLEDDYRKHEKKLNSGQFSLHAEYKIHKILAFIDREIFRVQRRHFKQWTIEQQSKKPY